MHVSPGVSRSSGSVGLLRGPWAVPPHARRRWGMAGNRQTLGAGATPDRRPAASQQPPGPTKLVPSEARKTGRSWDLNTLTGAQALSFDEVAETLSTRLGTHVPHVRVSPDAARDGTLRAGVEAWFAEDMARLHTMLAAGYEDVVTDDVAVATGTAPRSLAEFGSDIAERFAGRWSRGP